MSAEMNHALANELQEPLEVGIGIHGGEVIIGTLGYREHATTTAIGEAVHIASRLQDLTKEYDCQLVVSEVVGTTAGVPLDVFPRREVQVRGLARAVDYPGRSTTPRRWAVTGSGLPAEAGPNAVGPRPPVAGHSRVT